jgi:hypothetical protein
MAKKNKYTCSQLKGILKMKVNKKLNTFDDAPFFQRKMEKARKIIAIAGIPKQ